MYALINPDRKTLTPAPRSYGMKCFPGCLSDDELRNVRDLDMFEMRRRGYTRWRAQ